jgi:cation transport ATPase
LLHCIWRFSFQAIVKASIASSNTSSLPSLEEGTFIQEPGSGVSAIVDGARVSVGTIEWLQRQGVETGPEEEDGPGSIATRQPVVVQPGGSSKVSGSSSHSRVYVSLGSTVIGSIDVQVRIVWTRMSS